jgi:RNA polymerase sigma factor (sigma-70 family)
MGLGMVRAAIGSLVEVEAPASPPPPLLRCVQGDRSAWRALHRQYYPVAAAFLRKLGVEERDLEDACQDVFLQMFRYLGSFRGDSDTSTWLYRLCITQARRTRLRQRVARTLERVLAFAPRESLVSSLSFCEPSAQRRISAALDRLSEKERQAFVLYEMEGLPGKQVAEIVGCTEATLWRRLHEARQVFRQALAATEVDP